MLTIRREQMEVLSAYMRQSFEDRMVRHIAQAFPVQFKRLAAPSGDEPVRALIRQGILRAASNEITSERDVGRFIDLMVELGADFETQADTTWVRTTLLDKSISGSARMELIHQELPARTRGSAKSFDTREFRR